jgi:competence protein ComEC
MFILLAFPETMFGASFQMSFAATLAIVSLFETAGRHLHGGGGFWHKVRAHAVGIVATSLVATLATAPFVLYNFNRFALFGLIANMAVIPLATFVIMPGVVLSLLLMPLGLQWIGYVPLRYGTEVMMWMAAWVTGLPYSALHLVAPSDAGLGLAAVGLMWLCLMTQRWRWAGVPVMALGLATLGLHASPDVLISHDARQVMVRAEDGHYTMIKGSKRSFTVQNWLRAEGEDELTPLGDTQVQCDDDSCAYQRHGHRLVFVQPWAENDVVEGLCRQKMDVLVAWRYLQDCSGAARLVGRRELETYGAQALWFGEAVRSEYARQPGQDQRLWQVKLAED